MLTVRRPIAALAAAVVALPIVAAAEHVDAATSTISGAVTVTATAPDAVVIGVPFDVTVDVRNDSSAAIGSASGLLAVGRSAFTVKRVSSPTSGASCGRNTALKGSVINAGCGNVALAPGTSVLTVVTLVANAAGEFAISTAGTSAPSQFTVVATTGGPTLTVAATK